MGNFDPFVSEYKNIDFGNVKFSLEYWSVSELIKVPFTNFSGGYYEDKISRSDKSDFEKWIDQPVNIKKMDCYIQRQDHWLKYGTWYTPIIIIKSDDFPDANLKMPYQLFEGHTRLMWLNIINLHRNININNKHLVWILNKIV